MKKGKRLGRKAISLLLTLLMAVSLVPLSAVPASAAIVRSTKAATVQYGSADRGNGKLEITNDDFAGSMSAVVVEFSDVSGFATAQGVSFNAYAYNCGSPNGATFEVYASTTAPVSLDGISGTDNKLYTLAEMTGIEDPDRKGHEVAAALKDYMASIGASYCGTFKQTMETASSGVTNITASVGRVVKEAAKNGGKVYITMFISDMVTSGGWIPDQVYADIWSDIYINNTSVYLSSELYTYSALDSAIAAYEEKMDGTVYKNMLPAYEAYVAALEARDAYCYGGDTTADASTADALLKATGEMTEWNLHDSYVSINPGTLGKGFAGDSSTNPQADYSTDIVNNALYITQANDEYSASTTTPSLKTGWYNSPAVLVYDGETQARMPVMVSGRMTEVKTRYIYSVYPGTASGDDSILKLVDYWHGNKGSTPDFTWSWAQGVNSGATSAYNYATGQNLTSSSPRLGELDKSQIESDRLSQFMANVLYVDDDGMRNVLYKNYGGEGEDNALDFYFKVTGDGPDDSGTGKLKRSISVLNYAYHKDQIDTNYLKNFKNYICNSSNYKNYLKAIDTLSQFNIALDTNGYTGRKAESYEDIANNARLARGYFYNYAHAEGSVALDNGIMATVANVAEDLKLVSDRINECEAVLSENGAFDTGYEALREELTTSKAIYDNDRNLYNDVTWSAFEEKYLAAQSLMADADNNGLSSYYNDAASAQIKAVELAEAREALDNSIDLMFDNEFDFDSYVFQGAAFGSDFEVDNAANSITFTKVGEDAYSYPFDGAGQTGYMTLIPTHTYRFTYDYTVVGAQSEHILRFMTFAYETTELTDWTAEEFSENIGTQTSGTHSVEWTVPEGRPYVTIRFGVDDPNADGTFTFSNAAVQDVTHSAGSSNVSDPYCTVRAHNSVARIGRSAISGTNLDGALPRVTKTGYTFMGWYTGKNGTGEKYSEYSLVASTGNLHLWSYWKGNTYTITLNGQGATNIGTSNIYLQYDSTKYFSDSSCTETITSITVPTRTGYVFGGYYTGTDGTGEQYITADGVIREDFYKVMSDMPLHAMWTKEIYTITFQNADGTVLYTCNVPYKTAPTYVGDKPVKASDGTYHYDFTGWDPAISVAESDKVYTAKYSQAEHYFECIKVDEETHYDMCKYCGYTTAAVPHDFKVNYNEYEHWFNCSGCGANSGEVAEHTYGEDGVCTVCGYEDPGFIFDINLDIDFREWTSFEANSSTKAAGEQFSSVISIAESDTDKYETSDERLYITLTNGYSYASSQLSERALNDESICGNYLRIDLVPLNDRTFAELDRLNVNINLIGNDGEPIECDISVANVYKSTTLRVTIKNDETGMVAQPHTHSSAIEIEGLEPGEDTDGWKNYFRCGSCNALFEDEELTVRIDDLESWKLGDGRLPAVGHIYVEHIVSEPTCTEKGLKLFVCKFCGDSYTEETDALGHSFGDWEIFELPTSECDGSSIRICSVCGETETRVLPRKIVGAVVDSTIVCGLTVGMSVEEFIENHIIDNDTEYTVMPSLDSVIGTGSSVTVVYPTGETIEYKIVIFGDVNGDSRYDGEDAVIVSCLANGLLTQEQVGEAVYTAADCNHDGVIDELDVQLLQQAGILLGQIDQSQTQEEIETSSIYQEYISLIDQNPNIEITEETVEDDPADNIQYRGIDLFAILRILLKYIAGFIGRIIPIG